MHQYIFLSPQNSVFHTIIVKSMPGFTLGFYFSEVHNYKNLLSIQLSIHNCKYRHFQLLKILGSLLFMSDILLYLWCRLTAAQDTELSSSISVHGHSKIGKKTLLPILEIWVSKNHLPTTKEYWKNHLHSFFVAIRFQHHIIFQHLSVWGAGEA